MTIRKIETVRRHVAAVTQLLLCNRTMKLSACQPGDIDVTAIV
ncbi:hypothetical protein [Sphingomonas faeni]